MTITKMHMSQNSVMNFTNSNIEINPLIDTSIKVFGNISSQYQANTSDSDSTSLAGNDSDAFIEEHTRRILRISDIGYTISLLSLVLALLILTCLKRLRCPKNNLHLQLFISFIIRCLLHHVRRAVLQHSFNGTLPEWVCKGVAVVWQYSLMANYNWILMEGVYLYSLIFYAAVSPYGPSILGYILFGWLMPLVSIIPWTFVKANYEDKTCWMGNENNAYFWIVRAPITVFILINFVIYIRIVLVLYSKIFSGNMRLQASKRTTESNYKRLLRSTLVLIPLFGVHSTALLLFEQWAYLSEHDYARVVWLYTEMIFSSCQGAIVASLYCFLNEEVHQEIKRLWTRNK